MMNRVPQSNSDSEIDSDDEIELENVGEVEQDDDQDEMTNLHHVDISNLHHHARHPHLDHLSHHTSLPFSFPSDDRKDHHEEVFEHISHPMGFPNFKLMGKSPSKNDSQLNVDRMVTLDRMSGMDRGMELPHSSPLMGNVFRISQNQMTNNVQPAILYCKDINKFKKNWERWKKSSGGSSSSWQSELGVEVLLPRAGFEDGMENLQNVQKKQKRKSLSELSQQYKPIRKIISLIDEVCFRENGESFRELLRKLPEEKKVQEEIWIKRRKMAIEMEVSKKIKSELKTQIDISEGLSDQVLQSVEQLESPRSVKRSDDIHFLPENILDEWGFTVEQAKMIFERQEKEIAQGKKIFCRWNKIGKEIGNKHFRELPNIGERIHFLLRIHYPNLIPQKSREVSVNPKEEWGFDADDIKALIEQHDAINDPKKEKLSMRKIGEILGNKHRLHPEKKPFAERNDRNQLVHSLLKKKYPELAKRFERKEPVTRHPKRKIGMN